jgi:ATP-dependent Clp protease protease subunit
MSNNSSQELHPAEVAKLEADTKAALAEAAKLKAEARRAALEARGFEIHIQRGEIELAKAQRAEASELAKDDHNRVYRFMGPVTSQSVGNCCAKLTEWSRLDPGCNIEIVFSSPGGSIFDGFVLFDFVRSLSAAGHHITTGCLGMAASMAGVLLQMGDTRWVGREALVMIHRAAFGISGKSYEVEDEVDLVKRLEQRIIDIYVTKSEGRLTAAKIRKNWDRRDWWLSSEEALALGVVDEVR